MEAIRDLPTPVEEDVEVHDAVLLEEIDAVTSDARAILTSATFGLENAGPTARIAARYQAVENVRLMFYGLVENGSIPHIDPDYMTQGIGILFDEGADRAATRVEYARWGMPRHRLHRRGGWIPDPNLKQRIMETLSGTKQIVLPD